MRPHEIGKSQINGLGLCIIQDIMRKVGNLLLESMQNRGRQLSYLFDLFIIRRPKAKCGRTNCFGNR